MAWTIDDLQEHLLIGSTLVEGSTLTEGEARDVLAGRTVSGHPVREIRELVNYRSATEWLMERLTDAPYLSVNLVLDYHRRLMEGLSEDAGRFKTHANYTIRSDGGRFDYLHPGKTEDAMSDWVDTFNRASDDPVSTGADLYARFQANHPFADGNGRIGRVLLAYFLYRESGRTFHFRAVDKLEHLRAVEATDHGDLTPLRAFLRDRLVE